MDSQIEAKNVKIPKPRRKRIKPAKNVENKVTMERNFDEEVKTPPGKPRKTRGKNVKQREKKPIQVRQPSKPRKSQEENIKWSLTVFLELAQHNHIENYDYSEITEEHIKNLDSKVPVKCNQCQFKWTPTVRRHANGKSKCKRCANKEPWHLQKFLTKAKEKHGDKYDYSKITEDDISNKLITIDSFILINEL